MKKPQAFSYRRFSDKSKQSNGDSMRRQMALTLAWCDRNNVELADLTYKDGGKSAFHGHHLEDPELGGLAAFLKALEQEASPIPKGSYLIIESLDRLSRDNVTDALELLLRICRHVHVVQLLPHEIVYQKPVDPMKLIMAVMELSRGNSESATKSVRIRQCWERAKERGEQIPGRVPEWVSRDGKVYRLIPEAEEAVRVIFSLARDGYTPMGIVRKLVSRGIPSFGRSGDWNTTYIRKVLSSPVAYGRHPTIKDFPAAVTEAEFFAAQAARPVRKQGERGGEKRVYLFNRLIRSAATGERYHVHSHSTKQVFVPESYKKGRSVKVSFPVKEFETAILRHLREVSLQVVPDDSGEKVLVLEGRKTVIETKLVELEAALEEGDVLAVSRLLRRKQEELEAVEAELAKARQEASSPAREAWRTCRELAATSLDEGQRVRLRAAIARVVSRIAVLFVGHGKWRCCFAQIHFTDGHAFREVVILCHGPVAWYDQRSKQTVSRPARLYTDTWTTQTLADNDMATYLPTIEDYLRQTADELDNPPPE